jgi:hypothetical protein
MQWAHLLCDYSRVEDPSYERADVLEASAVTKQVIGLVSSRTVIAAGDAAEAFSSSFLPNLVSHLDPLLFLH